VNIFISEGAGVKDIVARMEAEGKQVQRDAFGHVKLDSINPGKYFADTFSEMIGAGKVLVQKSGYYARAARANGADVRLIHETAALAVHMAELRTPGVCALDEDKGGVMRCIDFPRIKGGKPFDVSAPWFKSMINEIGQAASAGQQIV
jgi:pyrophosphate--fructose-6-phosphate 1-phosphotransferase